MFDLSSSARRPSTLASSAIDRTSQTRYQPRLAIEIPDQKGESGLDAANCCSGCAVLVDPLMTGYRWGELLLRLFAPKGGKCEALMVRARASCRNSRALKECRAHG